jgi:hypothetical protein
MTGIAVVRIVEYRAVVKIVFVVERISYLVQFGGWVSTSLLRL